MQKYRSADVGHTPHRPRPDKEGGRPLGSTTPQPAGDPGKRLAHPSSALSCSPHIVLPGRQVGGERPLPRTFQRSRWGQNSKLRWHRAAPVHHCSRWLSKAKKGLGGGSSLSHHSKCVSVTDRPKTFVRPLTSLLLCCARTTAHVAVFRVRQQRNLHLGSHIKLLALFLKLSLILCTKESSQIQPAYT